jgi:hypothetical protein
MNRIAEKLRAVVHYKEIQQGVSLEKKMHDCEQYVPGTNHYTGLTYFQVLDNFISCQL